VKVKLIGEKREASREGKRRKGDDRIGGLREEDSKGKTSSRENTSKGFFTGQHRGREGV